MHPDCKLKFIMNLVHNYFLCCEGNYTSECSYPLGDDNNQTIEVLLLGKINYDEPPDDAGDSDSHDPDSEKFSLQGMYSH